MHRTAPTLKIIYTNALNQQHIQLTTTKARSIISVMLVTLSADQLIYKSCKPGQGQGSHAKQGAGTLTCDFTDMSWFSGSCSLLVDAEFSLEDSAVFIFYTALGDFA